MKIPADNNGADQTQKLSRTGHNTMKWMLKWMPGKALQLGLETIKCWWRMVECEECGILCLLIDLFEVMKCVHEP